jgi:nucleotide-binding universal stress UspA family protein
MWPMPHGARSRSIPDPMSADIIVSYDGTPNDDDAIALASLLAQAGATIALAYVRHAPEFDLRREELAEHDARRRLQQGAALLGDPGVAQHVVISPSTPEGLAKLAATERASVIVFGSDYRTPPGHAEPGTSAQNLLEGGPIAIAVAPAGLRTEADAAIRSIAVVAPESDAGARRTAEALAARLGATVAGSTNGSADLTVVGSQGGSTDGRIALSGATRSALDSARGSVLVLPTGTAALT